MTTLVLTKAPRRSHLLSKRSYNAWRSMKDRCSNKNHQFYDYYGGAGIVVCERWNSYPLFLEDMGEPAEEMQIDRIDPKGNYEPSNCRWATQSQNCANRTGWGKSGFKGVFQRPSGRFAAVIKGIGKQICLGTFDTAIEAARAFDEAAIVRFGEYAMTNAKAGRLEK